MIVAIQKQFHHLVRTIPSTGRIIAPITETHIDEVLEMGCWTPVTRTGFAVEDQVELSAELIQPMVVTSKCCISALKKGKCNGR